MAQSVRKATALFLTLALLFSFSIPAFAAETHDHDCEATVVCDGNTIGEGASPLSSCTSQTWLNECYQCGHSMPTTTRVCPGGPHGGTCQYLPA